MAQPPSPSAAHIPSVSRPPSFLTSGLPTGRRLAPERGPPRRQPSSRSDHHRPPRVDLSMPSVACPLVHHRPWRQSMARTAAVSGGMAVAVRCPPHVRVACPRRRMVMIVVNIIAVAVATPSCWYNLLVVIVLGLWLAPETHCVGCPSANGDTS